MKNKKIYFTLYKYIVAKIYMYLYFLYIYFKNIYSLQRYRQA